ncbi:hypothetical protein ACOMHN_041326 [Nucella lapillus]
MALDAGPLEVEVDLELKSIGPISEADMTWTTSFFLRQEWTDSRLKLEDGDLGGGGGSGVWDRRGSVGVSGGRQSVVKLRESSVDSVWQPDLFFSNSKEGVRHQLTMPNRLLYVNVSTGRVRSTQRLTVWLHCEMDQGTFPHDNQTLPITMESFSYSTDEVVLKWSPRGDVVTILPTLYIPDFALSSVDSALCTRTYDSETYPCLEALIRMRRKVAYYIFHTYIPTILIVILSWASFWIDHEAAPARVSVGLLTVLTITTQLAGSRAQMPTVPYIKAIDVWMSVNLVFVFAAYMEYALVSMLARQYKKAVARKALVQLLMEERESSKTAQNFPSQDSNNKTKSTTPSTTTPGITPLSDLPPPPLPPSPPPSPPPPNPPLHPHLSGTVSGTSDPAVALDTGHRVCNRARLVDKRSRVLFPLTFLIFNVVYWVYYLALR